MGLLNKTKCYLAGQLQYGSWDSAHSWRDWFSDNVKKMGVIPLSPLKDTFENFPMEETKSLHVKLKGELEAGNFDYVHQQAKLIRSKDLNLCDISDFLVVVIDPKIPTFGAVDEMITSLRNKKPVFLVIPGGYCNIPIWLASYFKPNWVFKDIESVLAYLIRLDSGQEHMDNKYWRILKEQYR